MFDTIQILNVKMLSISKYTLLRKMQQGVLITPNIDHMVKLQKDEEFYNIYKKADWIICDSKILLFASKFIGSTIKEAIPGSSLFPAYCDYHKDNPKVKIFLLGAAPGVANKAMKKINERIQRTIIVGSHSPSFGFENNEAECEEIIGIINNSDATVLVVGVGAPKQEKWISKNKDRFTKIKLFMALGATIDFEAGNIKRAPEIFQNLGLEWFYRLAKEPKRLWKRYLIDDIPFFYYLLKQKIGFYKNPFESTELAATNLVTTSVINRPRTIKLYIKEGIEYWGKLPRLTTWLFGPPATAEVQIPEELKPDHLRKPTTVPAGQSTTLSKKANEIKMDDDQEALNVG